MELEQEIAARASLDGGFVRVHDFLNHRVEPSILRRIGASMSESARLLGCDLVLTAEAGGIPIAAATALAADIPFVFAKKYAQPPKGHLATTIESPTRRTTTTLAIDPEVLNGTRRVLIVDDVLAGGSSAVALAQMARSAGCEVAAVAVVIDKTFAGGGTRLAALGIETIAIVRYHASDVDLGHATPQVDDRPGDEVRPTDPRLAYPRCFGCGRDNPIGLSLTGFRGLDDGVHAIFSPRPDYAGFDETLHGGIVATALDEASAWAAWHQHRVLVFTAKLEIRYRRPARSDIDFDLLGRVVDRRGRRLVIEAEMSDAEGIVGSSTGLFLVADAHMDSVDPRDEPAVDASTTGTQEKSTTTARPIVT